VGRYQYDAGATEGDRDDKAGEKQRRAQGLWGEDHVRFHGSKGKTGCPLRRKRTGNRRCRTRARQSSDHHRCNSGGRWRKARKPDSPGQPRQLHLQTFFPLSVSGEGPSRAR